MDPLIIIGAFGSGFGIASVLWARRCKASYDRLTRALNGGDRTIASFKDLQQSFDKLSKVVDFYEKRA